jgi:hypothetical protein
MVLSLPLQKGFPVFHLFVFTYLDFILLLGNYCDIYEATPKLSRFGSGQGVNELPQISMTVTNS